MGNRKKFLGGLFLSLFITLLLGLAINEKRLLNLIGVGFTMIGAILIAVDVIRQYRGKKFDVTPGIPRTDYMGSGGTPVVSGQKADETQEYKAWQKTNYLLMFFGLAFILNGGMLQIVASWP